MHQEYDDAYKAAEKWLLSQSTTITAVPMQVICESI